ncbi:MAG: glucan biosynthesis protein [Pannonibacter sp.]
MIDRRKFLVTSSLCLGALSGALPRLAGSAKAQQQPAPPAAPPAAPAFSFDDMVERMRQSAQQGYQETVIGLPDKFAQLDYDQHRAIRFRSDRAIWRNDDLGYEVQAFHPGGLYTKPVQIFEIDGPVLREMHFTGADFEYREPLVAADYEAIDLPGVAGFRMHYPLNRPDYRDELIAFLGSSYFRALGKGSIYGLSARGLAIDTAAGRPEEFPRFTRFFVERPQPGQNIIRIYAEMESERVTGAYSFRITPGINTEVEVDARIFLRDSVERLGIAPLTSMYLYGENDKLGFDDYRPEVHDSDGLLILQQSGERQWRPLVNPRNLALSFFTAENPKGFGMLQRDRDFASYQDMEAHYERRPSLWIEPLDDWGRGHIMLAEIPSQKEIHDNIVAFWIPDTRAEAGSEYRFRYRMYWGREPEPGTDLAQVLHTRAGHGGTAASDYDNALRKFVVEFKGGPLTGVGSDAPLEPRLWVQNASVQNPVLQQIENGTWRYIFDLLREDAGRPSEMTLSLALNGKPVTETWMYQWNQTV